jgi:hypothetical protein
MSANYSPRARGCLAPDPRQPRELDASELQSVIGGTQGPYIPRGVKPGGPAPRRKGPRTTHEGTGKSLLRRILGG